MKAIDHVHVVQQQIEYSEYNLYKFADKIDPMQV
jgi:hypothetical protein